jgi:hypothetical protein
MLPLEPLPATLLRTSSGKMQLLAKLLPKLRARGHRVLLFCQMTRMLDVVDDWLRASGVGMERDPSDPSGMRGRRVYSRVDGATPSTTRQRVIEAFNAEESEHFLMLVSTRAGGLGLNLATADTVIMYDPDFNPFVDEQAQSRAHRMGQRKEVCVYQLVTANTVEERIVELAKSKRAIERLVVVKGRATDDATDASALKERDDDTTNDRDKETGGERQKTKDGSVSRAAELAKVLMHGARKIVTRAAASAEGAENDPTSLEKKVNPKCAFRDSEIERLLDRANLPVEADGEDGDGYLGGVGDGRVRLENDEDEEEKDDDAPTPERPNPGEDLADAQLESLLAERAARLVSAERELLGRGKRERRTILPTNVERMRGEGENGGNELSGNEFSGRFPEKPDSDPDPFVTPCFICLDAENDVAAFPAANTLLRCESCTACAHPACAGVDEDDDETLFSAVLSAGGVSAPPRAWHCGSGGFACARHGKSIDGGRAAATASAALARRDVAEKHARRLAKRLAKQQNDAQNAQNARSTHGSSSDDDSDSMSTGANADDSDDGYDPGARSDSESESEFREGAAKRRRSASGDFVSGDGRKKRRVSLGDASTHLHSTKALESETRNARLAKTLGAFTSQLDWLKRNAGAKEKLFVPTGGENAGSADPKKKTRMDPVSACVAASAEFERLASLAAAFEPAETLRHARGGFPIDLLLVLRAAMRLDRASAFAAETVWAPRLARRVDEALVLCHERDLRAARCEDAYRVTVDPTRLRAIAVTRGWSEQETKDAVVNVTNLRDAARLLALKAQEKLTRARRERETLRRFVAEAPSRAKAALERRFQATLKDSKNGPFAGKNRTIASAVLKRAIDSCALDRNSSFDPMIIGRLGPWDDRRAGGARAFVEDSVAAFAAFADGFGVGEPARDLRGATDFLFREDDGPSPDSGSRVDPVPDDAAVADDVLDPAQVLRDSTWHPYVVPADPGDPGESARSTHARAPAHAPLVSSGPLANDAALPPASRAPAPAMAWHRAPSDPEIGAIGAVSAPGFPPRAPHPPHPPHQRSGNGSLGAGAPMMTLHPGTAAFAGGPYEIMGMVPPPGTMPPPGTLPPP